MASLVIAKENLNKTSAIKNYNKRSMSSQQRTDRARRKWKVMSESKLSELSEHMMSEDDSDGVLPIDSIHTPPMVVATQLRFLMYLQIFPQQQDLSSSAGPIIISANHPTPRIPNSCCSCYCSSSQKRSLGDITGTESCIIDPLVSKRPKKNLENFRKKTMSKKLEP